jgi:hypothetical protein
VIFGALGRVRQQGEEEGEVRHTRSKTGAAREGSSPRCGTTWARGLCGLWHCLLGVRSQGLVYLWRLITRSNILCRGIGVDVLRYSM